MNKMNKFKRFHIPSALMLMVIIFWGCERDNFQKLDERNWQITWSDEFNGQAGQLPDASKWTFDLGTGQDGWGNSELQSYTNSTANISLDDEGNLVITAINQGNRFTSARIKTQGLFAQKYGRFEARIKTPYGPGLWPAFWMLGENIETVPWPGCGEIDIMELRGQEPHIIHGTIHGPGYSGGNPITGSYALVNDRFDADFHIYAIEWDKDKIDFFVDDYLYQRIERGDVPGEWVYDQPFFILLNVAVGGNYVGFPTAQTPFPQKMYIDYVRVFREAE
ncbi:glycoside hydrolase family 16 protein [Lentimicrobium sp.]|jgi:beta-glucanase (GH16 family)|uniref:glycoside hydrolase family 16 protein n=2 Tax=Lentimicrobium sp. TaxID=2034841 RepID=UPI0025CD2337|nr:glycoside hydrolase family 16 protein [Lentimicrobium sp.]MCO5257838.1 glycoside hydrolase family 16 protein [Lentimicrobium sp.]HOP13213.1 glycoside hydrolase family 16 protein [Lentimicrobium sp.]HPR26781.1 glycoside hydrolase family 16 protein [Lentimicrobium sp.]